MFEIGYPAHPFIVNKRIEVINRSCFKYPQIIKNEIEFLHRKVHGLPEQAEESCTDEQLQDSRYEKEFKTGVVNSDYKKLLHESTKVKL